MNVDHAFIEKHLRLESGHGTCPITLTSISWRHALCLFLRVSQDATDLDLISLCATSQDRHDTRAYLEQLEAKHTQLAQQIQARLEAEEAQP